MSKETTHSSADLPGKKAPQGESTERERAESRSTLDRAQSTLHRAQSTLHRAQRDAALEALEQSEERFRDTFERAAVGIAHVAPDGRFFRINERFCDIVDYTQEEMLARTFQDITHSDDLETDLGYVQQVLAGELQTYSMEKRYKRKDGSLVWVNLTVSLVREPSGDPRYFISVVEDISERKRAEHELRESEERFRNIFENSPIGIYRTTPDGQILMANPALVQMLGYSSFEELALRDLESEGYHPDFLRLDFKQRIEGEGHIIGLESAWVRKDGSTLFVRENARAVRDQQGKVLYYEGTVEDVTEYKLAAEALKRRADQLAGLNQASQAITASLELDQVLSEIVSLAGQVAVSDYASVALVGEEGTWEWGLEDLPDVPAMQRPIRAQGFTNWIARSRQAIVVDDIDEDGTMHPSPPEGAPRMINPLAIEAGVRSFVGLPLAVQDHLLGVLHLMSLQPGTFRDQIPLLTTFANQAAVAIENARLHRQVQRRLEELVALHHIGRALTSSLNPEQILKMVVKEVASTLKAEASSVLLLSSDEGRGELVFQAATGPLSEKVRGRRFPLEQGIAGWVTQEAKPVLVPDVRQDPRFYPGVDEAAGFVTQSLIAAPLKVKEKVIGVIEVVNKTEGTFTREDVGLLSSIAQSIAVAVENARLVEEASEVQVLRELDRLRSELIANVSHELRTPLGLIKIFCTSLLREDAGFDRETRWKFLQGIEEETEKLGQIVDNLLDLGRMESGRLHLDKQPTDLSELARKAMAAMEAQLGQHRFVYDFPPDPLLATVDAKHIEQVLRNLLSNAIKYSPEGGVITVQGCREGRKVSICVRDEGIGIPEGEQGRVFERFYRVENEVTRRVGGVGLGLAVCQGMVEAHGGRIWVESIPGAGSTFCFSLPVGARA